MSRRKRGGGADHIYDEFGFRSGFGNNPQRNREAVIQRMYERVLRALAMNRFKWTFPDSDEIGVDKRFLERTLFFRALSVFYYDKDYNKYLALSGAGAGPLNMLDNPTQFTVVGNNFIAKTLEAAEVVPIWSNYERYPDLDIVSVYASRLANLDRSVEINAANARRSKVIVTPDGQRLSWVNINRQLDEGLNGIQLNADGIAADVPNIIALDLNVDPMTILNLDMVGSRVWNKAMSMLGIENSNQDKKERLVSAEVDANNDQTSSMRRVNLNAREMACDEIKKKFKLDVGVEYYTDAERDALIGAEDDDDDNEGDDE